VQCHRPARTAPVVPVAWCGGMRGVSGPFPTPLKNNKKEEGWVVLAEGARFHGEDWRSRAKRCASACTRCAPVRLPTHRRASCTPATRTSARARSHRTTTSTRSMTRTTWSRWARVGLSALAKRTMCFLHLDTTTTRSICVEECYHDLHRFKYLKRLGALFPC